MGAWVKTELILSRVCAAIIAICGVVCNVLRGYLFKATTTQCLKVFQKVSFYQQFCRNVGNALLGLF